MHNFEILGIGHPVVDQIIPIPEEFLTQLPGYKGGFQSVDYETLPKIIEKTQGKPYTIAGGSASNTIKGLANLGRKCALLGTLGKDLYGKQFLESIQSLGIVPLYQFSDTPTAQVICLITPDGERTFYSYEGASLELESQNIDIKYFENAQLVHVEGYMLLKEKVIERVMQSAKQAGAKVSFDLASFTLIQRYKSEIINLITRYVDVLFANEQEAHALTGLSPEKGCSLLKDLCETAIVLLGKRGCFVGQGNRVIHSSTLPVEPLDTTGAGDLFASGFLHGYLDKKPIEICAHYGSLTGAAVVKVYGGEISPKAWEEIKKQM